MRSHRLSYSPSARDTGRSVTWAPRPPPIPSTPGSTIGVESVAALINPSLASESVVSEGVEAEGRDSGLLHGVALLLLLLLCPVRVTPDRGHTDRTPGHCDRTPGHTGR